MTFPIQLLARLYAVGVVVVDPTTPIVTGVLEDCIAWCFRNTTCNSVFFDPLDSLCYLQDKWFTHFTPADNVPQIKYYVIHADWCSSEGYIFFRKDSLCLKISSEILTWIQSRDLCESEGARLVRIDTEEKDRTIMDFLSQNYMGESFDIGAFDPSQSRTFVWTDGSALGYTGWNSNEPNNCIGIEFCAEIVVGKGWNDIPCTRSHRGHICEKVEPN